MQNLCILKMIHSIWISLKMTGVIDFPERVFFEDDFWRSMKIVWIYCFQSKYWFTIAFNESRMQNDAEWCIQNKISQRFLKFGQICHLPAWLKRINVLKMLYVRDIAVFDLTLQPIPMLMGMLQVKF